MLYNLESLQEVDGQESENLRRVYNQIINCDIPEEANFIIIEHVPDKTTATPQRFFRNTLIKQVRKSKEGKNEVKELFNFGVRNIGDPDSLTGILLLIKTERPAVKYVMFAYNHSNFIGHLTTQEIVSRRYLEILVKSGTGITVNESILNEVYDNFKKANLGPDPHLLDFVKEKVVVREFNNPENYDMLTNAELANAIRKVFVLNPPPLGGDGLEAFFFNTCYTGNLDNLYLYADYVKYIVASEGETHFNTFHIGNIVRNFCAKMPTANVINSMFDTFLDDFKKNNPDTNDFERMILAAFDLTMPFREKLKNALNSLVFSFIADIETIAKIINESTGFGNSNAPLWKDCYRIFNTEQLKDASKLTSCYDAFTVLTTIAAKTEGRDCHSKIVTLLELLTNVMFEKKFIGVGVNKSFTGVSVYLNTDVQTIPEQVKDEIALGYSFFSNFRNEFARQTYWPEFIQIYQKFKFKGDL